MFLRGLISVNREPKITSPTYSKYFLPRAYAHNQLRTSYICVLLSVNRKTKIPTPPLPTQPVPSFSLTRRFSRSSSTLVIHPCSIHSFSFTCTLRSQKTQTRNHCNLLLQLSTFFPYHPRPLCQNLESMNTNPPPPTYPAYSPPLFSLTRRSSPRVLPSPSTRRKVYSFSYSPILTLKPHGMGTHSPPPQTPGSNRQYLTPPHPTSPPVIISPPTPPPKNSP